MTFGPFVVYTAGRLLVFTAVGAVLYVIGFRSWILAFAALLLSMPVSYVALRRQRLAFARAIEQRVQRRREERAQLDNELDNELDKPLDNAHDEPEQRDAGA
jgi:hypothetical protein